MTAESPYEARLKELPENAKVLRRGYPGWGVLLDKLTEPSLRSNDVRRILGLTYRQIVHWDSRELLWSRQESSREWRHFSIADMFGLALVKRVAELGIAFDKLRSSFAVRMGAPRYLRRALPYLVAGREAYLYTDFETFLNLYVPSADSPSGGLSIPLEPGNPRPTVLLAVKPILTDLATKLNLPDFKVTVNGDGHFSFEVHGVPLRLEELKDSGEETTPTKTRRKTK